MNIPDISVRFDELERNLAAAKAEADRMIGIRQAASADLWKAIERLKEDRPDERGDLSRAYAVVITQLEQAYAYLVTFIEG